MADWDIPLVGGCRCGKVRFEITRPPMLTLACHCRGCQQMTASAFSLTVAVPSSGFALTKGETVIGGLHRAESHYCHCDWCKNWLFTKPRPDIGYLNVRAMMLDNHEWFEPFVEVWTSEKLSWAATPAKHSFDTEPPLDIYPPLLQEFAGIEWNIS